MSLSSASISFQISVYRRPFANPHKAAWGEWSVRKGILIRIIDEAGQSGFGETSPLKYFGAETLNESIQFLASIPSQTDMDTLNARLKAAPPASAFGIWSAIQNLSLKPEDQSASGTAGLLSLGYNLEKRIQELKDLGLRTFKIKVGLNNPDWEIGLLSELVASLNETDRIRVDPNQSWNRNSLEKWSVWLQGHADIIDFIEEPLTPGQVSRKDMIKIANDFPVPLALDESLTKDGIAKWQDLGWPGYWILKPSLLGIPHWLEYLDPAKVVLSSIFETGIGLSSIINLSGRLPAIDQGLGTSSYFNDGLSPSPRNGSVKSMRKRELTGIWNHFYKA